MHVVGLSEEKGKRSSEKKKRRKGGDGGGRGTIGILSKFFFSIEKFKSLICYWLPFFPLCCLPIRLSFSIVRLYHSTDAFAPSRDAARKKLDELKKMKKL